MAHNPRILVLNEIDEVRAALREIGVDEQGVEIMTPKARHKLLKLENVDVRAANILKQEMLSVGGDAAVSRSVYYLAKDNITDVVLMATLSQYEEVCLKLERQPFGLKAIASEVKETLKNFLSKPGVLRVGKCEFEFSKRTYVMGILNVTPDSFSDGGRFVSVPQAVSHALQMIEDGADIIDVGGESTRPSSESVSLDEELRRVIPVIKSLAAETDKPISIDTYKAEVALQALNAGAVMVNDISGLRGDEEMVHLVKERNVPVCIMHMQGTPKDMQLNPAYECLMSEIIAFLRKRVEVALKARVKRENILIDPGIGFGKTCEHNLEILRRLAELKSLGFPILIGTSRKSFIGLILDLPVEERLEGTAATVAYAISQGANIIRVHDVKKMVRVVRMTDAVMKG